MRMTSINLSHVSSASGAQQRQGPAALPHGPQQSLSDSPPPTRSGLVTGLYE